MNEEKFMRLDTHVHTSGVSRCAKKTYQEVIEQRIEEGYDGLILTNHCQSWYYENTKEAYEAYMQSVLEEFHQAFEYGKARSFRVILGLEVTLINPFYSDWLLYGVTEEFLKNSPILYALSQRELFAYCEKHGVLMVHAHPFRTAPNGEPAKGPGEKGYLHGIEINCTVGDLPFQEKVVESAKEWGALVTCGSDFHGRPKDLSGGMFVPSWIKTSVDFARYLRETDETWLFVVDKEIKVQNFSKKV